MNKIEMSKKRYVTPHTRLVVIPVYDVMAGDGSTQWLGEGNLLAGSGPGGNYNTGVPASTDSGNAVNASSFGANAFGFFGE